VLLRRKPETTRADFSDYWATCHGPLVASRPEFWRYTACYTQNHVLGVGNEPFDGVAISTQNSGGGEKGGFPDEACYIDVIRPDELEFLDPSAIVRFLTHGKVLVAREETQTKLLLFVREEQMLAVEHAKLDRQAAIAKLVINRCAHGTVRSPLLAPRLPAFDGVVELWADDFDRVALPFPAGQSPPMVVRVREIEMPRPVAG
jgi:hypothetical protein